MKIGFIGTGNMGGALALAARKAMPGAEILLANRSEEKALNLAAQIGGQVVTNEQIAQLCDYIFLGVKPQQFRDVLAPLQEALESRETPCVLISMAAGLTIADVQAMASCPVIRIMPNTPVSVGSGVVLYAKSSQVEAWQTEEFTQILGKTGNLEPLPEALMDAGSAVSGCGPAFACIFMEALADGAVACGLPREQAMGYTQQMLLGTAKLALETGKHPAALKDAVCSPGGSTIAGVKALEDGGLRAAVMAAVKAAYDRTKALRK